MAFDGIFISKLIRETEPETAGFKIEKIYQNGEFEITLTFRNSKKLLISANPSNPYFCLIENKLDSPAMPPSFCMQLRKYLLSAKLTGIVQCGFDRTVEFVFEASDEMGDKRTLKLICEFMGRHSNIILVDDGNRILGAVKYVNSHMSSYRQILPGLIYNAPPAQNKENPYDAREEEIEKIMESENPSKVFLSTFSGFSKQLSGEAEARCCKSGPKAFFRLLDEGEPTVATGEKGEYKDIVFYRPSGVTCSVKNSFSEAVYEFYSIKTKQSIAKQKAGDLFRLLENLAERTKGKLEKQRAELEMVRDYEKNKEIGDILSANAYQLKKGIESIILADFYRGGELEIKLDPQKDASENIHRYYKLFKKEKRAFESLTELIRTGADELDYLNSVLFFLGNNNDEADIREIKEELQADGYIKKRQGTRNNQKLKVSKPLSFRSDDGTEILVGRNNLQNEALTFKTAQKNYIWLHVKNYPGSHVVIMKPSSEISEKTVEEAASLAVRHSRASQAGRVTVDYTEVRNVKKQPGGKPGMVFYVNYKSIDVTV